MSSVLGSFRLARVNPFRTDLSLLTPPHNARPHNQASGEIQIVQINRIALITTTPQNLVIIAIVRGSIASFLMGGWGGWIPRVPSDLAYRPNLVPNRPGSRALTNFALASNTKPEHYQPHKPRRCKLARAFNLML
jgi:hypothetical protein